MPDHGVQRQVGKYARYHLPHRHHPLRHVVLTARSHHGTSRSEDGRFSNGYRDGKQHLPRDQRIIVDDVAAAILPFGARVVVALTRLAFVRD